VNSRPYSGLSDFNITLGSEMAGVSPLPGTTTVLVLPSGFVTV
jgi:hypothetical protein